MKVAVVGGGVVGLFAAHHLRVAGAEVTVLDRGEVGGACSSGNAGWICPSIAFPLPSPGLTSRSLGWLLRSDSPLHIRPGALPRLLPWLASFRRHCNREAFERGTRALSELAASALDLFADLAVEVPFEHDHAGLLMVFTDARALDEELELLRLTGYEDRLRTLSPDELRDVEPALARGAGGGLLARPERHVRPESLCAALAEDLRSRGVEIEEGVEVEDSRHQGSRAVAMVTARGAIEADVFLIATGAEAGRLAARSGYPLPLQAGKGYSITVEAPRTRIDHPLYFSGSRLAVTPFENALRLAGTMELSGINLTLDPRRLAALERVAEREVPGVLRGEGRHEWVGMRPITPDGLPCIGRLPTRSNVYVAAGHQMLGMTLAPATGRALADLVTTGRSRTPLEAFDPARFH